VTGSMDRTEVLTQLLALAEGQLRALAADDVTAAQAAMRERGLLMAQWGRAPSPRTEEELQRVQALAHQLLEADRKLEERLRSALSGAETGLEQLRQARRTFRAYRGRSSEPSRLVDRRG